MNPIDNDGASRDPGEPASTFAAHRDLVLAQWRERVTVEVPVAARLGEPILVDLMPALYDNIAETLDPHVPRPSATSGTDLASSHGRERAGMTEYGPQDLVHEMQIFRDVLFAVARTRGAPLDGHDAEIVGHSIEQATREAISGYSATNREASESFVASLSHDLRNPLHVASASAQLIQLKCEDAEVVKLAQRICRKIAEADAMIQTMLDAAALKNRMKIKLQLTQFEVMELVEEVCADLPLLGQPIVVEGEHIRGWWCRASMKRVLENLISNANKYGDHTQPVRVGVARIDGRMQLSVHNEGEPIPEPDVKRLFRSFTRLDDIKVKGWGLGLPLVQNIAESHGGNVVVDSGPGRGTTFTVSLPVDARPYAIPPER